jgi:hypothetical protein
MRARWSRALAITTAIVFLISAVFPVAAGLSKNTSTLPHWWGAADVTIAFLLGLLALAVFSVGRSRVNKPVEEITYRSYRVLIHGIFALLVIFAFFSQYIVWNQCLSGLAWRSWLLLFGLPEWIALYRENI